MTVKPWVYEPHWSEYDNGAAMRMFTPQENACILHLPPEMQRGWLEHDAKLKAVMRKISEMRTEMQTLYERNRSVMVAKITKMQDMQ